MLRPTTKSELPLLTCPVCGEAAEEDAKAHRLPCPTCGSTLRDDEPTPPEPLPDIRPTRSRRYG